MKQCQTQGRALIQRLKRSPHSYFDMLRYGLSCSPWKRVKEALRPDEALIKGTNRRGLTTWAVRKA